MTIEKKQTPTGEGGYSLVNNSSSTVDTTLEFTNKHRNIEGMGWIVTCLFIVGETAGGGLIALPAAMTSAGLFGGILIILLGAIVCGYTGSLLSENWTILQSRWPQYREHCRKPYPAMGLHSLGPRFMFVVSSCLNVTQFGTAVVFLLLASKNIENFLHGYGVHVGFCYIILAVATAMLPVTMLKSPKDFWWAIIGAMITTSIAVSLLIYGSYLDFEVCIKNVDYPPVVISKFFMCFGTVMFAYGGHGAFPTIQHDMKRPYHFKRAVMVAFLIIFLMYLPVSVFGYITYGGSLRESVIPSIQTVYIQQFVNFLITLHVVLALTIIFNPLNQEWEDLLHVPHHFGIGRITARTVMMIAVVFVAETVPSFGPLLDLVGGSTITLMALVFPVIFNLFLFAAKKKHADTLAAQDEKPPTLIEVWKYTPNSRKLIAAGILIFAIVGGTAATVSSTNAIFSSEFSSPCYSGLWTQKSVVELDSQLLHPNMTGNSNTGVFNCCGVGKNISRFGQPEFYCLDPTVSLGGGSHG